MDAALMASLNVTTTFEPPATFTAPLAGVADRIVGGTVSDGGGGGVTVPTGVFMSAWISDAGNARLYTRTSSITPAKNSVHTALPPIRSGPVDVVIAPVVADEAAWTPLT